MIPTRTELDAAARASKRLAARYDGQRAVYNEAISYAIRRSGSVEEDWLIRWMSWAERVECDRDRYRAHIERDLQWEEQELECFCGQSAVSGDGVWETMVGVETWRFAFCPHKDCGAELLDGGIARRRKRGDGDGE